MAHLSASYVHLASQCLYPWAPGVIWAPHRTNEYMWRGTVVGACATQYINGECKRFSREKLRDELINDGDAANRWSLLHKWLGENKREGWKSEVTFACSRLGECSTVGVDLDRKYPNELDFFGTADLVFDDEIVDFKCAKRVYPHYWQQLKALCAISGRRKARIVQLDGTTLKEHTETFQESELDFVRLHIVLLLNKRDEAEPAPGRHCRDCPHNHLCAEAQK